MYPTANKQIWANDPSCYIYFLILIFLTIISLFIQASTEWTTSIVNITRRLSMLYYTRSKMTNYRNYLFALFIGFQEGYIFGYVLKFDVTCLFGLRHTMEILIIYGLSAMLSSTLFALINKYIKIMTLVLFTTLLHSITIFFLYHIRTRNSFYDFQPLPLRYMLFSSYGTVIGLWSTIALHFIYNSTKLSSSSPFAQALGFHSLGRILAYTCILFLCQSYLFYINFICLSCIFSFIFLCHCCCSSSSH